jgi:hypothetical protein
MPIEHARLNSDAWSGVSLYCINLACERPAMGEGGGAWGERLALSRDLENLPQSEQSGVIGGGWRLPREF